MGAWSIAVDYNDVMCPGAQSLIQGIISCGDVHSQDKTTSFIHKPLMDPRVQPFLTGADDSKLRLESDALACSLGGAGPHPKTDSNFHAANIQSSLAPPGWSPSGHSQIWTTV